MKRGSRLRRWFRLGAGGALLVAFVAALWLWLAFDWAAESPVAFQEVPVSRDFLYAYGATAADFDGDGKLDVAASDSWFKSRRPMGASVWIYWSGQQPEKILDTDTMPDLPAEIFGLYLIERLFPIDVDGDGDLDIAAAVNSHRAVIAFINPGKRGMKWQRVTLNRDLPGAVNAAVSDIDGDGDADLFVSMRPRVGNPKGHGGVAWIENPGRPGVEWPRHAIDERPERGDMRALIPYASRAGARPDLIASDATSGALIWYRNGDWRPHQITGMNMRHAHFASSGDIDGNGRPDLVLGVRDGLVWVDAPAPGHETIHRIAHFPGWIPWWSVTVTETAVADIDGDGVNDVAFSWMFGGRRRGGVGWARNRGNDDWSIYRVRGGWGQGAGVSTPDMDGDGRPDVLGVGEYGAQQVLLWRNRGPR